MSLQLAPELTKFSLHQLILCLIQGVLSVPFSRFFSLFWIHIGIQYGSGRPTMSLAPKCHTIPMFTVPSSLFNRFKMSWVLIDADLFLMCFYLVHTIIIILIYYFPYFSVKSPCGIQCYSVGLFWGDILTGKFDGCFFFLFLRLGERVFCHLVSSVFSLQSFCSHILHFGKYAFMPVLISFKYAFILFLL